ncbi:MAG: sigma-E factor negative regulatory protein [Woeseiaceae bacterium]
MNDAIRMQISAFVDGELPDNEADLLLRRMGQDAGLRRSVAEYLAIGRAMRGEACWAGVDGIHERVAAAIDDKPIEPQLASEPDVRRRSLRPLASVAAAAAVAMIAIFGLQQMTGVGGVDSPGSAAAPLQATAEPDYTVPQGISEQLREYYLVHGATATENGANGMLTRFVSLRLSEEDLQPPAADDTDTVEQDSDSSTPPQQP